MKTRSFGKNAQVVARGGIFTALGVVILLLAQPFEVLDLTLATIASVLVWFFAAEYGLRFSLCVYLATTAISLILTPANSGTVIYGLVLGWYPILKIFLAKKISKKLVSRLLCGITFCAAFLLMIGLFFKIFVGEMDFSTLFSDLPGLADRFPSEIALIFDQKYLGINVIQWMMVGTYALFAPIFALLYDLFLERLILFYIIKIRPYLAKHGLVQRNYK